MSAVPYMTHPDELSALLADEPPHRARQLTSGYIGLLS